MAGRPPPSSPSRRSWPARPARLTWRRGRYRRPPPPPPPAWGRGLVAPSETTICRAPPGTRRPPLPSAARGSGLPAGAGKPGACLCLAGGERSRGTGGRASALPGLWAEKLTASVGHLGNEGKTCGKSGGGSGRSEEKEAVEQIFNFGSMLALGNSSGW